MKRCLFFFIIIIIYASLTPGPASGRQLPLWEVGLGGTALFMPDYRGSDEYRWYFFPVPYVIYRGDILKIDREQISGRIFKTNRLLLDMSFNGSVGVDSSINKARQGMPNLDPTFEFGPSLEVLLDEDKTAGHKITLTFAIRSVISISTDLKNLNSAGWNFSPRLNIDQFNIGGKGLDFGMSFGPIFGDQTYHNYYYQVNEAYATPERPAFSAQGGYGGMQCTLSLGKKFKKIFLGLFVRGESLQGTAFSESPLLKTNISFMGGLYFSWIFMESKTLVEAEK
jgi:Outer membrane protein V